MYDTYLINAHCMCTRLSKHGLYITIMLESLWHLFSVILFCVFPIFMCGRFLILQLVALFYRVSCSRNQWCNQNHFCSNYFICWYKSIECWQWCI